MLAVQTLSVKREPYPELRPAISLSHSSSPRRPPSATPSSPDSAHMWEWQQTGVYHLPILPHWRRVGMLGQWNCYLTRVDGLLHLLRESSVPRALRLKEQ